MSWAEVWPVTELLLFHFSTRYSPPAIFKALREEVQKISLDIPVSVLIGNGNDSLGNGTFSS